MHSSKHPNPSWNKTNGPAAPTKDPRLMPMNPTTTSVRAVAKQNSQGESSSAPYSPPQPTDDGMKAHQHSSGAVYSPPPLTDDGRKAHQYPSGAVYRHPSLPANGSFLPESILMREQRPDKPCLNPLCPLPFGDKHWPPECPAEAIFCVCCAKYGHVNIDCKEGCTWCMRNGHRLDKCKIARAERPPNPDSWFAEKYNAQQGKRSACIS